MTKLVIVDAGPLVAMSHASEPFYDEVTRILGDQSCRFVIPAMCVAEATYLVGRNHGPFIEAAFLGGLTRFEVVAPHSDDWPRIAELVRQYADFPLGGTDASVVALAERYDAGTILTLDLRHFSTIKPNHRESFQLLPA